MVKLLNNPSRGKLLISAPTLTDEYFDRSVVLLADHSEEGSVGLIINKPLDFQLNDLLPDFPETNLPIYLGGPVHPDNLFYLHTLGDIIGESQNITSNICWGGNIEDVKEAILEGIANRDNIHFFLGYAGWASGQLMSELKEENWLITPNSEIDIFNQHSAKTWSSILTKLGGEYAIWANRPQNPSLN